jgi:hypothetical protein
VKAIAERELIISLTLSTMIVIVKLMKYLDDMHVYVFIINE